MDGLLADAERAIGFNEINQANDIAIRLETDRRVAGSSRFKGLRTQIDSAISAKDVKRANDRVVQLVMTATQDFRAKRYEAVEQALHEIFRVNNAPELEDAHKLANRLVEVQVKAANELAKTADLDGATAIANRVNRLPGVTEKPSLAELNERLANLKVAKRITIASELARGKRWNDAEKELTSAIGTENATDLTEAKTLLSQVLSDRKNAANEKVSKLIEIAADLPPEAAIKRLEEAINTRHATNKAFAEVRLEKARLEKRQEEMNIASAKAAVNSKRAKTSPRVGDEIAIADEVFGTVDLPTMDELNAISRAEDSVGLQQLMLQGRVAVIEKGTRAKLLKSGILAMRIRLPTGEAVWVAAEFVTTP